MAKNILITGGLGFIGSHLALHLSENPDYRITVVDAEKYFFDKGNHNYSYYKNIRKNLLLKNSIKVINEDLLHPEKVKKILKETEPKIIIHLASVSVAGIADYYPQLAKENIFDTTFNIIQAITQQPTVEKIIYISSSMVYGHFLKDSFGNIIPPTEETPCNPIDIYGTYKLCGEHLIKAYHNRKNLQYVIIRPTAVYGSNDCNFRVSELFVSNAILNRPILIDNGGLHQLDFTYIKDIINGIALTLKQPNAINQVFNISFGKGQTILNFAKIIQKHIPNTTIINNDAKPFRPNRGALNISKAKKLLKYKPVYSIEQGIEQYIDYVKKHINYLNYPEKYF